MRFIIIDININHLKSNQKSSVFVVQPANCSKFEIQSTKVSQDVYIFQNIEVREERVMSFSSKQFREALQDSSKLAQRFEKYLQNVKKHQIDATYYVMEEFYKILMEKESPLVKVNTLFALKMTLETCEYPAIEMAEAFLLSAIQEVALYQSDKRTYGKTSQYFKEKGYPGSIPNLQQLSHNYVTLATNLIFLAASIKQNCYFYTDRLMTPSGFQLVAKKLKEKKVEVPPEAQSTHWKDQYESNLNKFGNTPGYEANYLNFFKEKVQRYLVEGGKARETLDFRKLLRNGDSWLTSQILGCLNESLDDPNFQVRRFALGLLNQLFIGGDIEAVMIVNEDEVVERIVDRILQIKGSSDIGRGAQIYPEIAGQLQSKKNFYIQFLRCVDNWARLVPTSIYLNQEEESKMSRLLRRLKERQFIFPSNQMYAKYSKQFQENMKKNQQRNNYIVRTLNEVESERDRSVASNRLSKYSQKISLIKEMRESTILTMPEIEKLIEDTEAALLCLTKNQWEMAKNMKNLKYFSQEFEKKFELIEQSVTESRLQNTYVRGLKCLQKIEEIGPYYEDYKNGRIDFKRFGDQISVKCQQIDKSKSRVSDILSLLSKSKDILSRSGLDLSRSIQGVKPKELMKPDHILQKSANLEQAVSHNTKTLTNFSNLEDDALPDHRIGSHSSKVGSRQSKIGSHSSKVGSPSSKLGSNKEPSVKQSSKLSKQQRSSVSQSSFVTSQENPIVQKYETAKFVSNDQYQIRPTKTKKSSIAEEPSRQQSRTSNVNSSRPSAHFKSPPSRQKEVFQDDSSWSESEERQKMTSNNKSSKMKQSIKEVLTSGQRKADITDKKSKTQTRQIFSDSSFSKYDQSNEELRDAIDKSDNPDFRMVFKDRQPSQNSKMSKNTLRSHEHYAAVLESLAPKSIGPERDISGLSRDKSASQLPPKSHFDTSRMNLTGVSRFKDKTIAEEEREKQTSNILKKSKSSIKESIVSESKSNINGKELSKVILRESERMRTSQGSKLKQSSSNYRGNSLQGDKSLHRDSEVHQNFANNENSFHNEHSINPDYQTEEPAKVISVRSPNHSHVKRQSSKIIKKQDQSSASKVSKRSEHPLRSSERSKVQKKDNQYYNGVPQSQHQVQKQSLSGLDTVRDVKVKEIQELQKKIEKLREEEKQLFLVRSQWQSPTRPQTLRTAVSPRFRNNMTDYTQTTQTFKRQGNETSPSRRRQLQRSDEMNFNLGDKFRPPEGQLIYRRVFKKDLAQLDKHQKRKILKGKQLVFRNDDIEVGMMIHKSSRDLKIIYYVTPSRHLKTFLFKIESNPKIVIHAIPNSLGALQPRKQYRIYLFAEVLEFPFKLPEIHFKYHPELLSLEENLFESNQVNYFTSLVPFFFLKFFTMRPVNAAFLAEEWQKGRILRGDQTNFSRRVLPKHFFVLQYFPDLVNLQSSQYQTIYGMQCEYGSTRFLIRIIIKINKFFYVQGMLIAFHERENSEKIMQFAIACLTVLLEKSQREVL